MVGALTPLSEALWNFVGQQRAAFGVCLEKPKGIDMVESLLRIFEETHTIVVLSVGVHDPEDKRIADFHERRFGGSSILRLTAIDGADVATVVAHRWHQTSNVELPFAESDVSDTFSDSPRPIGEALSLFGKVLNMHADLHGNGETWPANRALELDANTMAAYLRALR